MPEHENATITGSIPIQRRAAILEDALPDYERRGWELIDNAGNSAVLTKRNLFGKRKRLVIEVTPRGIVRELR
ncbi:hypothetical protein [Desertivibrio insolitus]|uniref:hypothetical protein n=1 Tax=Herbiconiux sp. SYSU D00978 TaxID=2812562 RepID=UPI001A95B80C|nr:hypothetical protein [Herbiconiux sp. SYSU D00978]